MTENVAKAVSPDDPARQLQKEVTYEKLGTIKVHQALAMKHEQLARE